MRIQHNIMAMNAYRNYTNNTSALSKNLEKLSSGYKINRAGDDAAGLAISEKMRAQITGLEGAQKNAKDGISLVQTAEGALTEVHDMLNRMYSLAEQSANGTYDNETDRANLQKEVKALKTEIDRIADTANFNGINLLDGKMKSSGSGTGDTIVVGTQFADTVATGVTQNEASNAIWTSATAVTELQSSGFTDADATGEVTFTIKDEKGVGQTVTLKGLAGLGDTQSDVSAAALAQKAAAALNDSKIGQYFEVGVDENQKLTFTSKDGNYTITGINAKDTGTNKSGWLNAFGLTAGGVVTTTPTAATSANTVIAGAGTNKNNIAVGDFISVDGKVYEFVKDGEEATISGATAVTVGADGDETTANLQKALAEDGYTLTDDGTDWTITVADAVPGKVSTGKLTLQIGDTSAKENQLDVEIKDMHIAAMGLSNLDIGTQAGAKSALDSIKSAINYVSGVRGDLGAVQNRLEHTINNLSVMQENIQDAESSIRDTDIADEMMSYTKNNILIQSAQAMLAQANQVPQGVLQLLQ